MRSRLAPPVPIITTTCQLYERVLLADYVMIIPDGPLRVTAPFHTTGQCLLCKQDDSQGTELLMKMVGG